MYVKKKRKKKRKKKNIYTDYAPRNVNKNIFNSSWKDRRGGRKYYHKQLLFNPILVNSMCGLTTETSEP